jgi:hypothetical protein
MRQWFEQQDFYTEERMNKLQEWIEQEIIDIFVYTTFKSSCEAA